MAERHLAAPYHDLAHQRETATLGVWGFLATEVLFFGALISAYAVFRLLHPEGFAVAGRHSVILIGAVNTLLLVTSSMTMGIAILGIQAGRTRLVVRLLLLTACIGVAFLALKGYEYKLDWDDGVVPVLHFTYDGAFARTVELYFWLYFVMTGVHAIHLSIGIGLVLVTAWRVRRGSVSAAYSAPVEGVGLYWHFVDIVWMFLFTLIYLTGRNV
jgi:cytochrome c oxidase subunit III